MICVTLIAAQMYIDRVNPSASLAEANAAMQPCDLVAEYCRANEHAQYRNTTAHVVTFKGRAVEVWPRWMVVSRGPVSSRLGVLS